MQSLPANLQKLRQKAVAVGLDNPAAILRHELDAAKVHLVIQQKSYERRFLAAPSQLLLQDGVEVEMGEEDEEDDGMDVDTFDEDGIIV